MHLVPYEKIAADAGISIRTAIRDVQRAGCSPRAGSTARSGSTRTPQLSTWPIAKPLRRSGRDPAHPNLDPRPPWETTRAGARDRP
jgi:hypothetical protein